MSTSKPYDLSRSLTALEQDTTLVAVIEMSQSNWLVAAMVPGVERRPLKKLGARRGWAIAASASLAPGGGAGRAGDPAD
jgi:hypothetical protein